jgi:hypothetical protein
MIFSFTGLYRSLQPCIFTLVLHITSIVYQHYF